MLARNKLPKRNQKIFDIDPILNIVEDCDAKNNLVLEQLQKKKLMLLTIATMRRFRPYLGAFSIEMLSLWNSKKI
jgi:hypothetical protein